MYLVVLTNLSLLVLFFVKIKDDEKEKVDAFFALNSYVKGSYDQKEAFVTLNAALCKLEEGFAGGNRLFYLSLPPSVFAPVTTNLKECCMSKRWGQITASKYIRYNTRCLYFYMISVCWHVL